MFFDKIKKGKNLEAHENSIKGDNCILRIEDLIKIKFNDFEMNLSEFQIKNLSIYLDLLLEWNKKINLTAITEPEEIVVKHFIDSAALLKHIDLKQNACVIDVGTGAGFPGMVLKILRPDLNLTLLDSLKKRLTFLNQLLLDLNLDAELIHSRAEDGAHDLNLREKFDLVTSRAVARMNVLCEYCLGYTKVGGVFCPLKGKNFDDEMNDSYKCIELMGGKLEEIKVLTLPQNNERSIPIIKKIKNTPTIYPRSSKKILKLSL